MGEYLFFGGAILSIANGSVLLWVNHRRTVNQTFFLSCLCITLWSLCVVMAIREGSQNPLRLEALHFWLRASSAVGAFLCWLIWLTKAALIERGSTMKVLLRQSWPWFILSCSVAGIAFSESFIPSTATPEIKEHGIGYIVYFAAITICCTWFLIDALRRDKQLNGIRKIELRYFVVNAIIACLLVVVAHAVSLYVDIGWLRRSGLVFFSLLNCAAVWAICHHRVFDAKHIVLSIGQRALLLGALGLLAIALFDSLRYIHPRWSLFIASTSMIAVALVCDQPMRRWMGLDPAQILLAPRQSIIDLSREISSTDTLKRKFSGLLQDWSQTNVAILMSADGDVLTNSPYSLANSWSGFTYLSKVGWATPETLQRSKSRFGTTEVGEFMALNNFGAIFAAPKGTHPPSLVVCLGQKESLRPYTFPDINVLISLAELMDNILTHSRASEHAVRIEKMASAAMISRGLAHDLNNLATPVSTFLLHMEDRVNPNSPEAEVLADAKHSIKVMQGYIQESLFFARQLTPVFNPVKAHELLNSVSRLAQTRARTAGVSVVVHAHENLIFAADFPLMQRALQNLVFNGIDASGPGGTVVISADAADQEHIRLKVSDQGAGIAPHIRNKVFEPYFTTKDTGDARRGLGLGLAICKKIADLHTGTVAVSDNEPKGTTFSIVLPIHRPRVSNAASITENEIPGLIHHKLDQEVAPV